MLHGLFWVNLAKVSVIISFYQELFSLWCSLRKNYEKQSKTCSFVLFSILCPNLQPLHLNTSDGYLVYGNKYQVEDPQAESVGQAESESFNEAEVKSRKSGIATAVRQAILESLRSKTGNTLVITQAKTESWSADENDNLAQTGRRTQLNQTRGREDDHTQVKYNRVERTITQADQDPSSILVSVLHMPKHLFKTYHWLKTQDS